MKAIRNMGAPEFFFARTAFNLIAERGEDPERVAREAREQEQRRKAAAEYERKMQLSLEKCPGFMGCDAPHGPESTGSVVIQPSEAESARAWLKRRFQISEDLNLSDAGLVFKIASRRKAVTSGGKRIKVRFGKLEQFELPLA